MRRIVFNTKGNRIIAANGHGDSPPIHPRRHQTVHRVNHLGSEAVDINHTTPANSEASILAIITLRRPIRTRSAEFAPKQCKQGRFEHGDVSFARHPNTLDRTKRWMAT